MPSEDNNLRPPALDPGSVDRRIGTNYPEAFKASYELREKQALGDALGLTHYGVNLVRMKPGVESALRHWHTKQDEFVYVLEGELVLITDEGEQALTAGMAAGFRAGVENGHQLVNRSNRDALYLEVGDRPPDDEVTYPGTDLWGQSVDGERVFTNLKGEPY